MRPKKAASKTAAAMVSFDTPDDAVTALGICDNNVFDNDPSGRRLRWKHANLKKPSVPIVISSAPPSPPSAPMSPIPPDGDDVSSPEYDVLAAPQVDVLADLPDSDGDPPENPFELDLQMIGGHVLPNHPLFSLPGVTIHTLWPDLMHVKYMGVDS